MKLFFLLIFLSSAIFAQTDNTSSILELKSSIKSSDAEFENNKVNLMFDYDSEKKSVSLGIV